MGQLRFHLLGFPVFVQPGFWLLALLLGSSLHGSIPKLVMITAVLIVSILAHELGHALVARRYGQQPVITLHMMGGLTSWRSARPLTRRASVLITLAGPGMSLLLAVAGIVGLYAQVATSTRSMASDDSAVTWLFEMLAQLNVFWTVINLLPVLPLDGGQVLALAMGPSRRRATATVSLIAGLASAAALWRGFGFDLAAIVLAAAGVSQFIAFQKAERDRPQAEAAADELLRRGARAFEVGNYGEAATMGRGALALTRDRARLERAATLTAWAAIQLGDVAVASSLCEQLGEACEVRLKAAVLESTGMSGQALELLRAARSGGDARTELTAHLVRLELAAGDLAAAAAHTAEIAEDVPSPDIREVARRVTEELPSAAAALFAGLYDRDRDPDDGMLALRAWIAAGLDGEARHFLQAHAGDVALIGLVGKDASLAALSESAC